MYRAILTAEAVLSVVSDEELFHHLTGVPVEAGKMFCSPLRVDKHPSCNYYYKGGRWRMKDFGGFHGDCFDLIMKIHGCSYGEALEIALRMGSPTAPTEYIEKESSPKEHSYASIAIKRRAWTSEDVSLWRGWGWTKDLIDLYQVVPVQHAWLNGKLFYGASTADPCYAYHFGQGDYKLYFPLRETYRFICNTNRMQGLSQLPAEGPLLLVTKSLKDVGFLRRIGYLAVAPQGESMHDLKEIPELQQRFEEIVSWYDFDCAGVAGANLLRKQYDIQPIFLTNGRFGTIDWKAKDPVELYEQYGSKAAQIVKYLIDHRHEQQRIPPRTVANTSVDNQSGHRREAQSILLQIRGQDPIR